MTLAFSLPLWGTVSLWVLLGLFLLFVFGWAAPNLIVSYIMYVMHLKRTKPTKWTRECSLDDPDQVAMYRAGMAWSKEHEDRKRDVQIKNDGLNLYGEFYDFGSNKTALMVSGRTEGLRYNYYFAKAYAEQGYNILTIDQRAHGESDGLYNTICFEEHKDLLAWVDHLQAHCHTDHIVFHGICIGASTSLFAATSGRCPDAVKGMVAEGMYPCFWESFKNHMIELKKPVKPGLAMIDGWMKFLTGHSMRYGPKDVMGTMQKPLLMIHSKEDLYSLPEEAQKLYDACPATLKRLVWFEHGRHSHLRSADTPRYDGAIRDFLTELEAAVSQPAEETQPH